MTSGSKLATATNWEFSISIRNEDPVSHLADPPEQLVEAFRRDGFVALDHVISLDTVSALNDRLEHVLRGSYDKGVCPDKIPRLVKTPYQGSAQKPLGFSGNLQNVKVQQIINIQKSDKLFSKLACNPDLGRLVAKLAGWEYGTRLAQNQVWAKPPGAPPLVFHRDSAYFMFEPADVVTVWVALDDMDEELGPLEYVKESHKWDDSRWGSTSQFFQPNAGGKRLLYSAAVENGILPEEKEEEQTFEEACRSLDIVSMAGLKAGGISIHNGRTWHGSGKNQSISRPRRGLGLHFVPAEVRFTSEAEKSKLWKRYVEDKLASSEELVVPANDFPITWQP